MERRVSRALRARRHLLLTVIAMSDIEQLRDERDRLLSAIRAHRDARGDDRCWLDDEVLYAALPEGYTPPARDTAVELARCEQYIRNRHRLDVTYVSPQRRIEELEAELATAREQLEFQRARADKWVDIAARRGRTTPPPPSTNRGA
jgi:hypothetical protein